jgi:hypothetical protein
MGAGGVRGPADPAVRGSAHAVADERAVDHGDRESVAAECRDRGGDVGMARMRQLGRSAAGRIEQRDVGRRRGMLPALGRERERRRGDAVVGEARDQRPAASRRETRDPQREVVRLAAELTNSTRSSPDGADAINRSASSTPPSCR